MKRRPALVALLVILLAGQGVFHLKAIYPRWKRDYAPKNAAMSNAGLDPAHFAMVLGGFREFIAQLMWVRANKFFEQGQYDAVLPILRIVTLLDPHQIDVYATGMWHIGYNFTDTEQRSDRRYIPVALAFGAEGAANNDHTYEMYFETGWIWYHKIDDDYERAVGWWEKAVTYNDMAPARKNLLPMAYQRNGQIEKAINTYFDLYDKAVAANAADPERSNRQIQDTTEGNIDTMLVRMSQRGFWAKERGDYDQGSYDTKPPFDVGFSVKATVEEPSVIRFEGTWNVLPVGTRIRVVLKDKDLFVMQDGKKRNIDRPGGMVWDYSDKVDFNTPKSMTYMQDGLFVRDRRFFKRVDMSNDHSMYPFRGENYVLEFYYNPRSAPPHMQDKFGWSGEGMTDKLFLNTDVRPGQRVMFARLELTRDQILRAGEWETRVPVVKTPNYKETRANLEEDVFLAQPLRGDAGPTAPKAK